MLFRSGPRRSAHRGAIPVECPPTNRLAITPLQSILPNSLHETRWREHSVVEDVKSISTAADLTRKASAGHITPTLCWVAVYCTSAVTFPTVFDAGVLKILVGAEILAVGGGHE